MSDDSVLNEQVSIEPTQPLASVQARLGSYALDIALVICTLALGWIIWSFFTWQTGQTPAKRILKQQVVSSKDGQPFTFTQMLLRELVVKGSREVLLQRHRMELPL